MADYKLYDAKVHDAYNKTVVERISPLWDKDMFVISKWNVLSDGFVNAGKTLLDRDIVVVNQTDILHFTFNNIKEEELA